MHGRQKQISLQMSGETTLRKGNKKNRYLGIVFSIKINESRPYVNFLDLLNKKTILYSHRLIAKDIFDKVSNSRD